MQYCNNNTNNNTNETSSISEYVRTFPKMYEISKRKMLFRNRGERSRVLFVKSIAEQAVAKNMKN